MLHSLFRCAAHLCAIALLITLSFSTVDGQQDSRLSRIDQHIESGEFSRALDLTQGLEESFDANPIYAKIAGSQLSSGGDGYGTAMSITDDGFRNDVFGGMLGGGRAGASGGVTRADFDDLINLINETIAPDSWEQNGGTGRISPFPSGVYVDGHGTLKRLETTKLGKWNESRLREQRARFAEVIAGDSELRLISITRLERHLQRMAAAGQQPTDSMRYLGGIYELQYLMVDEKTREIIIAGPAGPWHESAEGRVVNVDTGRPVLQLDDLVVALRNARQKNGAFYCSIEPRQENLKAATEFRKTTKLTGQRMRDGFRKALGHQDIIVDGIDPRSHAAHVMIEADYRMKRVGFGLEPGVVGLPSYLDMIDLDDPDRKPSDDVIRWWFTSNYDAIATNKSRDIFQLNGQGVKVLSESELLKENGQRVHTGKSNKLAADFARNFTTHFPEMAAQYPVYGELKNLFDLTLVAALIESESVKSRANVSLPFFNEATAENGFVYQIQLGETPKTIESIMNHRTIKKRTASGTLRTTVFGVSGGVEFDASKLTDRSNIKTLGTDNLPSHAVTTANQSIEQWWWDQ